MKRHKSKPYNPNIANAFFRAGYVETWGRGIQKICEECKSHGIQDPEYDVLGGDITVKFSVLSLSKASSAIPKHQNIGTNIGANVGANETQQKIMDLLVMNPRLTALQLSDQLGISKRRIEANIKTLKELQLIERKGATKNGYWVIK